MEKNRKKQIVVLSIALVCIFILVFSLFHKSATKDSANPPLTNVLTDSISQIVSACPGEIGVAVIVNNRDTVKVNNKSVYPMMSVFKVHQALALCNDFDNKGISLDTLVNINMEKNRKKQIVVLSIALVCIFILVFSLFHKSATKDSANPPLTNVLTDSISQIVSACPGEIGVAVIVNNRDTVKVNNKSVYPMMSVFKVHQALALCNDFDNKGISLDTLVNINRDKLDPKTWSPMLKDYSGPVISLTVRDLLRYTLTQSDNNASNLMFKDMVNVAQTDSFIATLIPRSSFQIAYTEEEMSADHNKAYSNYTSPLGAAMLMNRLFTEGLIDDEKQSFIKNTLKECKTGVDRIAAPLLDKEGVVIAHKTGSGCVNENGVLAAHNDVAYICLPNNISYTLAVFVKDFKGNESQASQYVAHISAVVYSLLMQTSVKS